ncbi:unnamed protein product [Closterium sp. Naga37s-1]|nr:unnamed protein product [Closterium sp. Naga37s-1]
MAVDVASMSVEELEAVWLRRAGMRSDLSVTMPGVTASGVTTLPLPSLDLSPPTSDFFQESSSEDPDSGRNHIDISGLPGGERAFKQVASFCYGMDFKISPLDAPALACAAAFLGMNDDSRKGMGKYRVNLLSFAAAAMAGMLKHADAALAVLRGCAGLLAEADALGIVDEAADRLADHAVTSHNLCTTPIHTSDGIALLPLDIFLRLLAKFKEKNLPEKEIGSAIAFYAQHNLPDPKSLASLSYSDPPPPHSSSTSSSSASSLSPAHYRRVLEGLTAALPAAAASVPMQPLLGLLRCAIVLNASEGVKATLQRGEFMFKSAPSCLPLPPSSPAEQGRCSLMHRWTICSCFPSPPSPTLTKLYPPCHHPLSLSPSRAGALVTDASLDDLLMLPLVLPPVQQFHLFFSHPPAPLPTTGQGRFRAGALFSDASLEDLLMLPLPSNQSNLPFSLSHPPYHLPSFTQPYPIPQSSRGTLHRCISGGSAHAGDQRRAGEVVTGAGGMGDGAGGMGDGAGGMGDGAGGMGDGAGGMGDAAGGMGDGAGGMGDGAGGMGDGAGGMGLGDGAEEHLSTLPDRAQALQAAASLIDAYLLHLSSPPTLHADAASDGAAAAPAASAAATNLGAGARLFSNISAGTPANNEAEDETSKAESQAFQPALSVAEWKHLVSALPADARPSHDGLLKAVTANLTAFGAGLADWEVAMLVGVVTPSRLSPSAMEAAAAGCSLLPLPFLVSVLRIQKEEARAALQQQQRQVDAEEAETRKAEAAVGQLKERVAAQRGRKREVQRELLVVKGLLHGFASEEHLSTLPDRAQALQAAASLIDAYLLHLSSPPTLHADAASDGAAAAPAASAAATNLGAGARLFSNISAGTPANNEAEDETSKAESQAFQPALSVAEWKHLVSALPADARPSHDGLLKAVTANLTAFGAGLADWEVAMLVGVVTPSRLSPSAMEAAAAGCSLLPLPFLVSVLRIQKEEARAALQQQQRQVDAEEAETRKAEAAVGQLKERVAAQRGRKREVQRELLVVKAALLEDHRALQTELAEAEARKGALEQQLRAAAVAAR